LATAQASAEEASAAADLTQCYPETAWVVPENDGRQKLRKSALPTAVAERLAAIGREYFAGMIPDGLRSRSCEALYGAIYRYPAPGDRQLFLIILANLTRWGETRFFLYDPRAGGNCSPLLTARHGRCGKDPAGTYRM
ncbi:MAG TPA: hypothetical protein VMM92_13280, partial [Thermoanaerobaculia bacterium]|nr:hypothetical protein [Thermoanaerobaculia bacterium]